LKEKQNKEDEYYKMFMSEMQEEQEEEDKSEESPSFTSAKDNSRVIKAGNIKIVSGMTKL
jgi:hypothetical protein